MNKKKRFVIVCIMEKLFSVVMPVYKTEKYLEEAILSVVDQDIGFEKNIQLILINDGSPDKSEEICLKYQKMYPKNIKYIYQENAGVSAARNKGLKAARGKYISFLDSDDKWEKSAFSYAAKFFNDHADQDFDFITCRVKHFESKNSFHYMDWKFDKGTRLVDIFKEPEFKIALIGPVIVKRESIINLSFKEGMKIGEDARFINDLLLEKGRYGLLKESLYLYRSRFASDSASDIGGKSSSLKDYKEYLENTLLYFVKKSKEKYGKVIPYVQYVSVYILGNCLCNFWDESSCTKEEVKDFESLVKKIASYISFDVLKKIKSFRLKIYIGMVKVLDLGFYKFVKKTVWFIKRKKLPAKA